MRCYAPIIIPTLCRFNHFKQCIESLQANPWAKYTTLYLSLDFPSKQEHEEGYVRIKEYILEGIQGFKEVKFFFQKKNLGPDGNARFLINQVYKKYDRYIFTEDDNVFASNVIEYWNIGLELFEEDSNIIAICAKLYEKYFSAEKNDIYRLQTFSAYGYATWKSREEDFNKKINIEMINHIFQNRNVYKKIVSGNITTFRALLNIALEKEKTHYNEKNEVISTDYTITFYMMLYNKYAIFPRQFLTKNIGYDGSGVNCRRQNCSMPENKKLSTDKAFELFLDSYPKEEKIIKKEKWYYIIERIILIIEGELYKKFGKEWYCNVKKIKNAFKTILGVYILFID